MAIINGLGPRKLHMEQHGQMYRILDQNNMVYCEVDDLAVASAMVDSRNSNAPRQKRYVQISKTMSTIVEVDSATDAEAFAKAQWDVQNLVKRNRIQWKDTVDDVSKMEKKLVQENEYENYRRWRDTWKP